MLKKLQEQNVWYVFIIITLVSVYFSVLMNKALPFEQMMYNSLSEQLSVNRINVLIENQKKWAWLGYILLPIILVIKWFLVAVALDIGALVLEIQLKFKKAFQIAMLSEIAFLLLMAVKFGWYFYHRDTLSLEYMQLFMPLSLSNFFNLSQLDKWFIYPLQVINVFEIIYWLLLSHFISLEIKKPFTKSLQFIALTYGIGLLVWVVFMGFLILHFN